jgi:hypothetical protein
MVPAASTPPPPGLELGPITFETEPATPSVRRRRPRAQQRGWIAYTLWAALAGGVIVLGVLAVPWIGEVIEKLRGNKTDDTAWVPYFPAETKYNFRLTVRQSEWKESEEAQKGLRAFVGLTRTNPDVWLAVAAEDFGKRNARDAEMEKGAVDRLGEFFKDRLEWEPQAGTAELAGQPSQILVFQGDRDRVVFHGECRMVSYRGIGYWVFVWAKTLEIAEKHLDDLQDNKARGFVLRNERRGWEDQPPELESFRGKKYPFEVRGLKGMWEGFPPGNEDVHCDLYLQRATGGDPSAPVPGVRFLVLVVDAPAKNGLESAMKDARASLLRRLPETDPAPTVQLAPGQKDIRGTDRKVGDAPGRVAELRVTAGSLLHWAVLAVVRRGQRVYVIQGMCPWRDRQKWRGELLQMLDTFGAAGG